MDFFGIGILELLFVLVIALLVLGPQRMVDAARTVGKYIRELQRATSEVPRLLSLDEEPPRESPPDRTQLPQAPASEQRNRDPET